MAGASARRDAPPAARSKPGPPASPPLPKGRGSPMPSGAPSAPTAPGAEECFPRALRYRLGPDGQLSDRRAEPVAADIRPGHDSRPVALARVLAGVLGVDFGTLREREKLRRRRRRAAWSATVACVLAAVATLAFIAVRKAGQAARANSAVRER